MGIFHIFLGLNLIAVAKGGVESFALRHGDIPETGATVSLDCGVDGSNVNTYIYVTDTTKVMLSQCHYTTGCLPLNIGNRYSFTVVSTTVTTTIHHLNRTTDGKLWLCTSEPNSLELQLNVYAIPTSMTLQSPPLCDLATTACSFTCKTDSCAYPEPSFHWFYSVEDDATTHELVNIGSRTKTSPPSSCSDSEKMFQDLLTLDINTFIPGNQQSTLRLLCKLQFNGLPTKSPTSNFSPDVVFAVKVSHVEIYDDGNLLTGDEILTVTDYQQKTLTCVPGYGHPRPTVQWYIGGQTSSSETTFVFIPSNSIHNKRIYCAAENIRDGKDVAVSGNPKFYVKVKIKYAYIEPAADGIISAIEGIPQPVICVTSGGRPHSTITWLKLISGQESNLGVGDIVEHPTAGNNLEMTKSTKEIQITRQDSGWKLSCSAVNVEGSDPVSANNSKSFDVLYPPEEMRISFSGKLVTTATIDVVRGSTVVLRCFAVSNPPVENFSWNVENRKGENLTIDNVLTNQMVNCTARNTMKTTSNYTKQGYSSISKEINVLYEAKITRITVSVDDTSKNGDTVTVNENDFLSISCVVDSNPGSYINLEQSSKLLTQRQHSLELVHNISSAMCSHNSEYACKAWNGVKNDTPPAEKTLQLNVRCSPRPASDTDSSVVAQNHTSAVLSITFLAYPVPSQYTWYKNSSNGWEKLTNSPSTQMTNASLQFNLTISNVKIEDYGEYNLTVENGIGDPYSYVFVLQAHGDPESQTDTPVAGSTGLAVIIGGVVGGLVVACLVIIGVVCFLRRRNSFEGMKTKLFGPKSTASRDELNHAGEEIKPQDEGYSYALVDKPKGGKGLNIVKESNVSETMQDAENTTSQPTGYLYSVVNKEAGENKMKIVQEQEAKESAVAKGKTKKTKGEKKKKTKPNAKDNVAAPTGDDDRCYENPMVLTESNTKVKPPKKGKPVKAKDTKPNSQDHDGLKYVEVSFSDLKKSGKKKKTAKPKVDDRTVYDPVQFGVVGEAYPSSEEEDNTKK